MRISRIYLPLFFLFTILLSGCGVQNKTVDPTVIYSACSLSQENSGLCSRFMDRDVYFVDNSTIPPAGTMIKNNPLDIAKVQASLRSFACLTQLGCNYFIFHTDVETNLQPIVQYTTGVNFKSFIQVWPDEDFGTLYNQLIPNSGEPNAIVVTNPNNQKQFYMILKGSCFSESGNVQCTGNPGVLFTSDLGLTALVARNLGRLVRIPLISCSASPLEPNTMCGSFPSNSQWSVTERGKMAGIFNNALETIALNSDFYLQTFLETVL